MQKLLLLFFIISINSVIYSQKKPSPPKVEPSTVVGTSSITKNDKWIKNFSLSKKQFSVYQSLKKNGNDTIEIYKIASTKAKFSELEITKYKTNKGKIIGKGSFTIENNLLIVTQDMYDYIGCYRITDTYKTDKYGFNKISDKMEPINTDNLSDRYMKQAEMSSPYKN